ncbi:MAG: toprim domain-containing protein [Patescibacteria group bacterium]
MNSIEKLSEMFASFPGIGPRQAKRFVYYLLYRNNGFSEDLVRAVKDLNKEIVQCSECMRYFACNGRTTRVCSICSDEHRDHSMLMVVPRDIDLEAVEKSGSYKGHYFVLGGSLPILEKEPEKRIRSKELGIRIKRNLANELKEIILAMNANAEGENTVDYIREQYQGLPLIISTLGRGLSTGAELEYADPETLKNAFLHRTK